MGLETLLLVSFLASSAGAVVSARQQMGVEKRKREMYRLDMKQSELKALDDSVERSRQLRLANDAFLVRKGGHGVLPGASSSVEAVLRENTRIAGKDLMAIKTNLSLDVAKYTTAIDSSISSSRSIAASTALEIAGGAANYKYDSGMLSGKKTTSTTAGTAPISGAIQIPTGRTPEVR